MQTYTLTATSLPLSPSGAPPTDFTLIRRGTLSTIYGDFEWTDRSARACQELLSRRSVRFMWDYCHLSDCDGRDGKPLAPVHDRRAAGNGQPIADSQGFHLRGQEWTPDAANYIRNKEYLYFSPVIGVDEKTKEVIAVLKASLTNDPATLGCAPLTLSATELKHLMDGGTIEELSMSDAKKAPISETPSESHAPSAETPGESHLAAAEELELTDLATPLNVPTPGPQMVATSLPSIAPGPTPQAASAIPEAITAHPHGSPAKHEVSSILIRRLSDGHTLWGRRHDSGKYTAPGGHLKKDERPIDAAVRELREETGIESPTHSLTYLGTVRTATETGAPIDVHGYHLVLPDHVVASSDRDPDREVRSWEYLACHPLNEMHAPRNALSVLSPHSSGALFHSSEDQKSVTQSTENIMPLSTNHQQARALLKALLPLLPSIAADQASVKSLTNLDASLAQQGATGEGYDVTVALSVLPVAMEITKSVDVEGLKGKLYSLAASAEVAPVALKLSTEAACMVEIDRGIGRGSIAPAARKVWFERVQAKKVSLLDCSAAANGAVLYSVPSTSPAPEGANGATVSLSAPPATGTLVNGTLIEAKPPVGVKTGSKVELSTTHQLLVDGLARDFNIKVPVEKVAHAIASMGQPEVSGARGVENPGN